jgi:uncharacterized protein
VKIGQAKLGVDKIAFALAGLASIAAIGWGAWFAYGRTVVYRATFSAGSSTSESFVLMRALKTVVERHNPRLKVTVAETSGTSDSLTRLARGDAQFAVAHGDVITPRPARMVARLFSDTIQIVVPKDSGIRSFAGLKGKRIAGGQQQTFLFLARPFGLRQSDFVFTGSDDDTAAGALASNSSDALFAVRPLHTGGIAGLTEGGAVRFIPLDNAQALQQDLPAYEPAVILKDSYQSFPSVPETDTPTVSVNRLLLAREDVPNIVVFRVTQALMERREEIAQAIPDANDWARQLAASIRPPVETSGWSAPVHPGAALYYANGDVALSPAEVTTACVVICMLAGLWLVAIYLSIRTRQKSYSDNFNLTMMKLVEESKSTDPRWPIEAVHGVSLELLTEVVKDFCDDKISARSFHSSRSVWQIASGLLRGGGLEPANSATSSAPAPKTEDFPLAPPKQKRWSILRDG